MALQLRAREDRLIPFERILLGWLEDAPAFPTQMERERHRSRSTCARTLKRLEKMGYVEGHWVPTHQGPPRRLYALTSDGRGVVQEERS
jgi:DNA-binding HxlR family transcriptional regulator